MDLFLALTNDDENNIMSCMMAKRMGARRVIALINRRAYAELMQGSRIDIALVPAQTTIGQLLAHVRRGDVVAVHSLRRGAAEALEAIAHGDAKSLEGGRRAGSRQIDLPAGAADRSRRAHHRRAAPRSSWRITTRRSGPRTT